MDLNMDFEVRIIGDSGLLNRKNKLEERLQKCAMKKTGKFLGF
jgi:hypothetical protein